MDMRDQDESRNVEDVRGSGGGGFQFRPVHGIGLGTVAVALIVCQPGGALTRIRAGAA